MPTGRKLLLAAALALTSTWPAQAHFAERTDSLWGFVARSDLIVVGTVVKSQRFEESGHTTTPGAIRLHVEEVLKGEVPLSEVGIMVEGMHQPRYDDRETVVVFAVRKDGALRSLQSRSEKVSVTEQPAELAAVRRYVAIAERENPSRRGRELAGLTLELLHSPDPRLAQDAAFDLNRQGLLDAALDDRSLRGLGDLALEEGRPLLVREAVVAKLGALALRGRRLDARLLERLALEPPSAAIRVSALNALARVRRPESTRAMLGSLGADDHHVRLAAVEGLAELESGEAVRALAERQTDPEPRVRFAALKALFRIGTPEARAELRKVRDQGSPEQARMVAQAAEQIARSRKGNTP